MTSMLMADEDAVVQRAEGVIRRAAAALRDTDESPQQANERRRSSALRWLAIAALTGLLSSVYWGWYVQQQRDEDAAEVRCRSEYAEAQAVAEGRLVVAGRAEDRASGLIFREVLGQAITGTPTSPDVATDLVGDLDAAIGSTDPALAAYEHALAERDGAVAACAADASSRPTPYVPPEDP